MPQNVSRGDGLEVAQAKEHIESGSPFILDVREPEEWHAGHIEGSINIPLGELGGRVADLPHDRQIIAVCRSGHRSGIATFELQPAGYQIENMLGGMNAWAASGYPIEPRDGQII